MATFKSSIVRIWGKADSIVGAGFLVDERHIVTCSHVVERALTLGDPGEAGTQANTVSIDFPFLTGASPRVPAHVEDIGRSNVKHWDIGGLVLSGEAPRGASPVRLVTAESMWGHRFRAFGFPPGRDYGEWAVGKIMDAVEGDWLQIDPVDFRGARVREGYSGTPVWDESLEGTAGMVVAADKGDQDRIAYILPASILVEAWSLVLKANSISPCPYRGLSAFTECESQSFFGREAFLATLLEVVKRPTSTILIAPSGSGKTSVLMAGLAPELRAHGEWLVIAVRPGRDPFSSLSYAVSETMDARQSAPSWAKNPFEVLEAMKRQPLVEVLSQLLRVSGCGRLLLIADQFEELFTLCRDAKVRDRWLEELIGVGSDLGGGVQALVSMRSDYERRGKAQARSMETILNWPRVTLPVMSDEEIRGVIERPAIRLGVTFEPGLVEQILTEFCDHPGGLPMLQFMLTLLWERQVNRELTLSDYRTLGGVAGALAKYADDVFDRLSEDEQRQARRVLLQLVGLVEVAAPDGATDARRPLLEHEVRDGDWDMIRHLSQERLLYLDQAESGEEVAELTHESLAWSWPRLEEWIAEADKALRASDQIADRVAMRFSIGAGAANLLPPPADMIAVGTTFAMMGRQIAKAYDLRVDREILRTAGISMAQGIAAASGAAYGGTQLVKAFPGMSVWVGLLIQPPLVAAIAYAVAATWKFYFHVVSAGGRGPDNAELREFVITMFRNKLGEVDPVAMPTRFGKWRGRSKKAHHP